MINFVDSGYYYKCKKNIFDAYTYKDISNKENFITGCPYCKASFTD